MDKKTEKEIGDQMDVMLHATHMMKLHRVYAVIGFVTMVTGIVLAVREWSWWSLAYVAGAMVVALLLQTIAGFVLKDPKLVG
jgi:hypothetical protein